MLPAEKLHPGADSVHQNNQGSLHLHNSSDQLGWEHFNNRRSSQEKRTEKDGKFFYR